MKKKCKVSGAAAVISYETNAEGTRLESLFKHKH